MTTLYQSLAGGNGEIDYTSGSPAVTYPEPDMYNVFGPIWLPRVYGKDLSMFEVASSGTIALTLNDIHSLDFERNNTCNVTSVAAVGSQSLWIGANNSNMYIHMDAHTNDTTIYSSNNLILSTGNGFTQNVGQDLIYNTDATYQAHAMSNVWIQSKSNDVVVVAQSNVFMTAIAGSMALATGSNGSVSASNNFALQAKVNVTETAKTGSFTVVAGVDYSGSASNDLSLYAVSNVSIWADKQNVNITAGSNFVVSATNNASVTSGAGLFSVNPTTVTVEAYTGDVQIKADSNLINMAAACNVSITAGSNFVVSATNNASVTSGAGKFSVDPTTVTVEAYTGDVQILADSNLINMSAACNVSITAGSNFVVSATNNASVTSGAGVFSVNPTTVTVEAFTGDVQIKADSNLINMFAACNVSITAGSNFVVSATNNASVTSGAGVFSVNPTTVRVEAFTGDVQIKADSNLINITAASNVSISTGSNYSLVASQNGTVSLSNNYTLEAKVNVTETAKTGVYSVIAGTNALVSASNSYNLEAKVDIVETAKTGNFTLVTGNSITESASNNMSLSALSNVTISATTGLMTLYAYSNVSVTASNTMALASTAAFTVDSGHTFGAVSLNNASLTSTQSNITLNAGAGAATISLQNDSNLNLYSDFKIHATATSNMEFTVADSNIMYLYQDRMVVMGNIDVYGTLNSIATQQTELNIEDKTLTLAFGSNIVDGPANDNTGVVVNGLPDGVTSDSNSLYDKSFMWKTGTNGVTALGGATLGIESFWELRGGAFRLTHKRTSDQKDISFDMRISESDTCLEIVKRYYNNSSNAYVTQRVAKFGRA